MDRQFRFPDESGKLIYYWPSGKNFVSVVYDSGDRLEKRSHEVKAEFFQRYLDKYPSSL